MAYGLLRVTNHSGLWVIRVSRSRITHVGPAMSFTAWLSAADLSSVSRARLCGAPALILVHATCERACR